MLLLLLLLLLLTRAKRILRFAGLPDKLRRTGVDGTLHRISRTVNPISGECTTVAARIGRVIQGHVEALLSTAHTKGVLDGRKSVLIIGPPNVGKTTVLREFARVLSEERTSSGQRHRVVAVVDKSLEIAGSGNIPHSSIGPCRVLQVDNPENQHASMIEAVENQSPDVVVVDEITNRRQAEAARTIAQRGVAIVATVHGAGLPSIINDPERRELVGGVTSGVLLSDTAAKERADGRKAVEKRRGDPAFDIAIEIRGFHDWIIHEDIGAAVDAYVVLDFSCLATPSVFCVCG
jgi:stage III sporulation protein AA